MTTEPANPLEVRMARLEGSYEQIDKRLSTLETRLENGFNDVRAEIRASRVDTDAKFDKLEKNLESRFNLIAIGGGIIVVLQLLSALDII